jgi:hypothetical protein
MSDLLEDVTVTKVFCDYTKDQYNSLASSDYVVKPHRCIEQMTRDATDSADRFSGGLAEILRLSTGYKFDRDSIATNGWRNYNTADRIRKDGNYINFAAAEAYGICIAYRGLLNRGKVGARPAYIPMGERPSPAAEPEKIQITTAPVTTKSSVDKTDGADVNKTHVSRVRFREEGESLMPQNPSDVGLGTTRTDSSIKSEKSGKKQKKARDETQRAEIERCKWCGHPRDNMRCGSRANECKLKGHPHWVDHSSAEWKDSKWGSYTSKLAGINFRLKRSTQRTRQTNPSQVQSLSNSLARKLTHSRRDELNLIRMAIR